MNTVMGSGAVRGSPVTFLDDFQSTEMSQRVRFLGEYRGIAIRCDMYLF